MANQIAWWIAPGGNGSHMAGWASILVPAGWSRGFIDTDSDIAACSHPRICSVEEAKQWIRREPVLIVSIL